VTDWFEDGSGNPVDVAKVLDGTGVIEALSEVVQLGALVSLGTTSDGGSLGITVTLDGRWKRHYGRDAGDFGEFLVGAVAAVRDGIERPTASTGSGKRQRGSRGR
jgi:hypothetical protein